MKLSIMVPFYNSEEFLGECLDSILQLTYTDFEILCLNDGSTDHSEEIVERYCKMDSRVCLVNKKNTGYGDTLNTGISYATGDYIAIIESDDILIAENMEKLIQIAEEKNTDFIKGNYNLYYDKDHMDYFENIHADVYDQCIIPIEHWKLLLSAPSIWSGIYKKSFLTDNHIWFIPSPGASYQDTSFMFKVWVCAQNAYIIKDPIVNYRQTNESSSSNSTRKIFDIFRETTEIRSFLIRTDKRHLLPIGTRVKFESFAWNLNRLSGQARELFLAKLYFDVRQDFYEGNLIRDYWEVDNWNIIFNVLMDYNRVIMDNRGIPAYDNIYNILLLNTLTDIGVIGDNTAEFMEKLSQKEIEIKHRFIINDNKVFKVEDGVINPIKNIDKDILILIDERNPDIADKVGALESNFMHNYITV